MGHQKDIDCALAIPHDTNPDTCPSGPFDICYLTYGGKLAKLVPWNLTTVSLWLELPEIKVMTCSIIPYALKGYSHYIHINICFRQSMHSKDVKSGFIARDSAGVTRSNSVVY